MIVRLHRQQISYFRRKARRSATEIYAMLLGKQITPQLIEIYRFAYPKLTVSTVDAVQADVDSMLEIETSAADDGLDVVGSIHSHPGAHSAIYMSKEDLQDMRVQGDKIAGICEVADKRCYVAFWRDKDPLPVEWKYFDEVGPK